MGIAIGCALVLVIAVYVTSKAISAGRKFFAQFPSISELTGPATPPAQLHVGQQLPWRTLYKVSWPGLIGSVTVGDFTGEGDDDVLFIHTNTKLNTGSDIIEFNGNITPVKLTFGFFIPGATAWDYDGDGIDEVVPHNSAKELEEGKSIRWPANKPDNLSLHSAVFKTDMSVSSFLFGAGTWQEGYRGDFDGDDIEDLMLHDYSAPGMDLKSLFYAQQGRKLGSCVNQTRSTRKLCGDIDGDGRDEIVYVSDANNEVQAYRYDMPIHKVCNTPAPYADAVVALADVDGDGCDDLLNPRHGYLNIRANNYVQFTYPASAYLPKEPYGRATAGDYDSNGLVEVVFALGEMSAESGLYLFDAAGNCTYYEEMGSGIEHIFTATASGKEHLVVVLSDRIVVYP